jgi:serine/threonine protein kinase
MSDLAAESTMVPADVLQTNLSPEEPPPQKAEPIPMRPVHIEIQLPQEGQPPRVDSQVAHSEEALPLPAKRKRTPSDIYSARSSRSRLSSVDKKRLDFAEFEVDFQQRLKILLAMEEGTTTLARKIYSRFAGQTEKLPAVLELLERRWGFPSRLFPLLWTNLRRSVFGNRGQYNCVSIGHSEEAPEHVEEKEWVEAFVRWLQAVHTRCGQAKLSRKDLVRRRFHDNYGDVNDVYFQGPLLGEGCYGKVHLMFHKALGVERAVKIIQKDQLNMAKASAEEEVTVLRHLDHPHIVRIYETFEVDETLHIVMDYAEGGDLAAAISRAQQHKQPLPESWCRDVAQQISSALEYMHSKGVIHCDLKPANGMLLKPVDALLATSPPPHVVLVDFGISEMFRERHFGAQIKVRGTPLYLSPEAFEGEFSEKSDMWALGVIVYEMLTGGKRPFESESTVRLLVQVATREPPVDILPQLSREVVRGLLAKDPIARLTAKECRAQEWFACGSADASTASVDSPSWKASQSSMSFVGISQCNYFQRAAMFCVAAKLSMKDMGGLFEIFQSIDTDKSGCLSFEQFSAGLEQLGIQEDPAALMAILDVDQNGSISYTEFLAGTLLGNGGDSDSLPERMLKEAFSLFDLDGDGSISMHELRVMLSGDGPLVEVLPDGNTVDQIMQEVSNNEEGVISYAEFASYIRKAAEKARDVPSVDQHALAEQPVHARQRSYSKHSRSASKQSHSPQKPSSVSDCDPTPSRRRTSSISDYDPTPSRRKPSSLSDYDSASSSQYNDGQAQQVLTNMMLDLDSIESKKEWCTPMARDRQLSSLAEADLEETSNTQLSDNLPPLHRWVADVCSQPEDGDEIRCLLNFPEVFPEPASVKQNLATLNRHFWATMFTTRLLAEDPQREMAALRRAVSVAVEAHDRRLAHQARLSGLLRSDAHDRGLAHQARLTGLLQSDVDKDAMQQNFAEGRNEDASEDALNDADHAEAARLMRKLDFMSENQRLSHVEIQAGLGSFSDKAFGAFLLEQFQSLDANGDGEIGLTELAECCRRWRKIRRDMENKPDSSSAAILRQTPRSGRSPRGRRTDAHRRNATAQKASRAVGHASEPTLLKLPPIPSPGDKGASQRSRSDASIRKAHNSSGNRLSPSGQSLPQLEGLLDDTGAHRRPSHFRLPTLAPGRWVP